jgi:hypothetical protein
MVKISDFLNVSARENVEKALAKACEHESFHAVLSLSEGRALERAAKVVAGGGGASGSRGGGGGAGGLRTSVVGDTSGAGSAAESKATIIVSMSK